MIAGNIVLEEIALDFEYNPETLTVTYTVTDNWEKRSETLTVAASDFFCALSIAVHNEGMPDWKSDYDAATRAMGDIRWIP